MTRPTGGDGLRLGVDGRELRTEVRTGIGRYLTEVLRAAARDGWECLVYGDGELALGVPGVAVRVLAARATPWWDQVTLPRQLGKDRVSVFLSPYYKGPLLAPCPVVVTVHDLFFIGYPGRPRPIYDAAATAAARLYARRATAIIADSEYSKRAVVTRLRVRPAKVVVIPVTLAPGFGPASLGAAPRQRYGIAGPYILYVGNFKPHKNLPALLRAYARLPEPLRAAHRLVLAGGDREGRPDLERLARDLDVADRVGFPGPIDEADLPGLYGEAALFVLPSLEEGFGLPAVEAMACGAPVLASSRAALPEVLGDAALFVDPADEAAVTGAMARGLSHAGLRDALRRRGLGRAREFAPDRTAGRVLALLREAGARP